REAMAQLNANEAELLAVRAAFYPSLNVNGFIALNGFNINYLFNPASLAFMGLAGLTAPLLNRNELNYQHQWQAAERNIAIYNYQRIWLESVAEVSSLFNSMQAYEQVSELKFNEVTELKQASSIANDLFLTGYANYLEVLMVRRNVLEAELQLTNARKEFLHSYIDLYKALGGGWN
ncbi:MAG TPA: TolC family protein, partial [Cyclobacteriaceae bacterium]|nr:TolC family protein [Cyclobacteriaceae bacterium]